jgi:sterol desaturase/sphingolipid hydroxylase (fatty acid hydroxylase superfamily)
MTALRWTQCVCFGLLVSAVALLVALERRYPHRPGQAFFRDGFHYDLFVYSFAQSYVVGTGVSVLMDRLRDQLPGWHPLASLPMAAQVALFLIGHDLALYWFHRLQHASPRLWWTHALHHSNRELDWLAGSRATAVEIFLTESLKYTPMVLLGAAPEVAVIKGTVDAIWGMYLHANLDVRTGPLQYLFNGPEMHRFHHALDRDAWNKNFATKLALWDWLFGTAFWPRDRSPIGYGLQEGPAPRGYLAQQFYAFPWRARREVLLPPESR